MQGINHAPKQDIVRKAEMQTIQETTFQHD